MQIYEHLHCHQLNDESNNQILINFRTQCNPINTKSPTIIQDKRSSLIDALSLINLTFHVFTLALLVPNWFSIYVFFLAFSVFQIIQWKFSCIFDITNVFSRVLRVVVCDGISAESPMCDFCAFYACLSRRKNGEQNSFPLFHKAFVDEGHWTCGF